MQDFSMEQILILTNITTPSSLCVFFSNWVHPEHRGQTLSNWGRYSWTQIFMSPLDSKASRTSPLQIHTHTCGLGSLRCIARPHQNPGTQQIATANPKKAEVQ